MDPLLIGALGLGAMFALILLQVPIGFAMIATGIVGFGLIAGFGPAMSILATEPASNIASVDLAVVPLFLLMGSFASAGGLSADIYTVAYALLGHKRGGLAYATVGGCGLFGAICGSSPATAATFGRVALPEMLKRGYAPSFAAGTIAAGGTLGSIVPPSVDHDHLRGGRAAIHPGSLRRGDHSGDHRGAVPRPGRHDLYPRQPRCRARAARVLPGRNAGRRSRAPGR